MARILLLDFEPDSLVMLQRFLELGGNQVMALGEEQQLHEVVGGAYDLALINMAADCSNVNHLIGILDKVLGDIKTITITDSTGDECMQDRPGHEFMFRPVDLDVIEARVKKLLNDNTQHSG